MHVSLAFLDPEVARIVDPGAPTPATRLETLRILSEAGVPTGIACSPIIPGLNDRDIAGLLERAAEAGARRAFSTLVRLPGPVADVFEERLRAGLPDRVERILSALRDERGGELNDSRFGSRMAGRTPRWDAVRQLFELQARRHGLELGEMSEPALPEQPQRPQQGDLFAP
ncbi:MAG: radical SAM protein [Planctomycetota bacterium]